MLLRAACMMPQVIDDDAVNKGEVTDFFGRAYGFCAGQGWCARDL
jgi:hypothetical protein